jgi:hypothetical protein
MIIKIVSTKGQSWGSYIDHGYTTIEIKDKFSETKIGSFNDGSELHRLFLLLGYEVEYEIIDPEQDILKLRSDMMNPFLPIDKGDKDI